MTPLAFYIHWPFCKAKCPYCDFNSHVRERIDFAAWKRAILAEIEHTRGLSENHRVESIFFGGGTPSLMPAEIAEAAIAKVRELWPCEEDLEITLEANPTSVEADTFPAFKQAGVNRLSIGVQSLRQEALAFLGREHSAEEAMHALALARRHFTRYSFDLIYARPGQTLAAWEEELTQALALAGGHLSLYQLTIEENTAFHTAYAKGAFTLPDEETQAAMYELTTRRLADRGMHAYEVSNYAKPGEESRHNLAYWRGHDYAGIGAGAHGRLTTPPLEGGAGGGVVAPGSPAAYVAPPPTQPSPSRGEGMIRHATLNLKSPERWLASVEERGHGQENMEAMSARMVAEERLMMGLRIAGGMALSEVHGFLDTKKHALAIREGLLEASESHLVPTPKGRLVLTSLAAMLLVD